MEAGKIYYSIAEVQQETGLPISTLRYWETRIPELSPRKDGHGNRYYTEADICLIKRIAYLRDQLHITRIDAIRAELQRNDKQTDVRQRATEILQRARRELIDIRAQI